MSSVSWYRAFSQSRCLLQYFRYFYYSNVLYYCYDYCTKQYSILLLAVSVLMIIIFKLNILGMYEYLKNA